MKPLKFRAWHKTHKIMLKEIKTIDFKEYIYHELIYVKNGNREMPESSSNIKDVELMQFTGLYDSKGKEIYEGDILKITDQAVGETLHQVIYDICFFDLLPEIKYCDGNSLEEAAYQQENGIEIEIIGNIYETPELLK